MRLTYAHVRNFRALEDVRVDIDSVTTLIVGRNNSGKTSLVDIFHKFFKSDRFGFVLEDIPASKIGDIANAISRYSVSEEKRAEGDIESSEKLFHEAVSMLPAISLTLGIEYDENDDLAALSEVILDLDEARHDVQIVATMEIDNPLDFFAAYMVDNLVDKRLRRQVEFAKTFTKRFYAVDARQESNRAEIDKSTVDRIFATDFIYAQNKLDDGSIDKTGNLSKAFGTFYRLNGKGNPTADQIDQTLVDVAGELDAEYAALFQPIFQDLQTFGLNTIAPVQPLKIVALLEATKVLQGNTTLYYESCAGGPLLPEAHNGLGYTKLIYTILQFVTFYENYMKAAPQPAFQVLFIEEPEAHLHPQMQEVFIKNIRDFIRSKSGWNVQVVITTHSSHIVANSGFEIIRYFDRATGIVELRDLSKFRAQLTGDVDGTMAFLKQYMVLHRCDMFFSDKVVLIEGAVERLLLPEMIKRSAPELRDQYISVVEVGGAYALKFKELLAFLKVPTLIITDIDSVDPNQKRRKCPTDISHSVTSNQTLQSWLPQESAIATLRTLPVAKKIDKFVRVAYQIPEILGDRCGRSFEEAFIIKNYKMLHDQSDVMASRKCFVGADKKLRSPEGIQSNSYEVAEAIEKKIDFAFDVLNMEEWDVPLYIDEGLRWLSMIHS